MEINTYIILKVAALTLIPTLVKYFYNENKKNDTETSKNEKQYSNNIDDFKDFLKYAYPMHDLNNAIINVDQSLKKFEITHNGNTVTFAYHDGKFLKTKIERANK